MNRLNRSLILECLKELSDRQTQESLWKGRLPNQQSSFEEAVEGLFTDSGLGDELTKGATGFSNELATKLHELERQVSKVEATGGPTKVIDDPAMARVRDLASVALDLLKREMK
jgi:hypothetical protein